MGLHKISAYKKYESHCIDTPEDVTKVLALMER